MRDKIFNDVNQALREGKKDELAVLRMVKAAMLEKERENGAQLSDEQVFEVINKQIKTRNESLEQFQTANRTDLVEKTQAEIDFLQQYLPKQLDEAELDAIIEEVFQTVQPTSSRDMGKVMKTIMPKVKGKADMGTVNRKIKEKLGE